MSERINIGEETTGLKGDSSSPSRLRLHPPLRNVGLGQPLSPVEALEAAATYTAADALIFVLDQDLKGVADANEMICGAISLEALADSVEARFGSPFRREWEENITAECGPEFGGTEETRNRLLSFTQGVPTSADSDLPSDSILALAVLPEPERNLPLAEKRRPASLDVLASVFEGPRVTRLTEIIGSVKDLGELDKALGKRYSSAGILEIARKALAKLEVDREQTTSDPKVDPKVVDRAIKWARKNVQKLTETVEKEKKDQRKAKRAKKGADIGTPDGLNGEPFCRKRAQKGGNPVGPGRHSNRKNDPR